MSNYYELPDLLEVMQNIDRWIFETQKLYEQAIQYYTKFKEQEIECTIKYHNKIASEISNLKESGMQVTIIKEVAKSNSISEYREMSLAGVKKKKYSAYIDAYQERLNTLKFLGKSNVSNLK